MTVPRRVPGLDRYSGLYLWAAFIVTFSIWRPELFPTTATVHSVASGQAVAAILGIALVVPLAAGVFDLSIGSTTNLSAIVVCELQASKHWSPWPAICVAIGVSTLIGLVNGLIVTRGKIDSFIVTLGMGSIVAATQTIVSGDATPVPPTGHAWRELSQAHVLGFNVIVVYAIVLAVVVWWGLEHTPAGRYVRMTGSNREAARLSGVRVDLYTVISLMFSGALAGIAGVLYASLFGPSLTFGPTLLLPAFAAAFLGSTQIRPGRYNVWGTFIAVYTLATGVQGLEFVTSAQWLSDMFNGVALIGAVWFAVSRRRVTVRSTLLRRWVRRPDERPPGAGSDDDRLLTPEPG